MQLNGSAVNGVAVNGSGQILRALSQTVTYTSSSTAMAMRTADISRLAMASGAAALWSLAARAMTFSAASVAVAISRIMMFLLLFSCGAVAAVSVSRRLSLVRSGIASGASAFYRRVVTVKTSWCATLPMLSRVVGISRTAASGASARAFRGLIRVILFSATGSAQFYLFRKMILIGTANAAAAISKLLFVSASCNAFGLAASISAAFLQRTREQFMSAHVLLASARNRVVVAAARIRCVIGGK